MPVQLDDTDIAILRSLMEDGRKSFRAISRQTKVSSPTIKSRYDRLVNMGLIKSVKPEIDLSRVDKKNKAEVSDTLTLFKKQKKHFHVYFRGLNVKLKCELCGGPIHDQPKVLRFARFERFFCCNHCRASYKEKHGSRIEMLKEQYKRA